jgi:hypothetical protein
VVNELSTKTPFWASNFVEGINNNIKMMNFFNIDNNSSLFNILSNHYQVRYKITIFTISACLTQHKQFLERHELCSQFLIFITARPFFPIGKPINPVPSSGDEARKTFIHDPDFFNLPVDDDYILDVPDRNVILDKARVNVSSQLIR